MIKSGNIREDFNKDLYYMKIIFVSDDANKKTTVCACASWEFLCDTNKVNKLNDSHLKRWKNEVIDIAKAQGDNLYNKKIHYFIFANTDEGRKNGLVFLKEICK